jgi:hypothetical protein
MRLADAARIASGARTAAAAHTAAAVVATASAERTVAGLGDDVVQVEDAKAAAGCSAKWMLLARCARRRRHRRWR